MSRALSSPACEVSLESYHDWSGRCPSQVIIFQLLLAITEGSGNSAVREKLQEVGPGLTNTELGARISLTAALENLEIGYKPNFA
ncbi:hypothetical protein N7478_004444 [Penicillium angulare]|uniref:uncharacterized protein n=1 Tax=Penicillium angulare TaxID=116970 RepID=UPI0025413CCF|nr:uncharacterized protein N7478_004444 [Penicillium angulare]KAJ5279072.1 hypothetical protein N7478_004444 [Penicillium angulare]